MSDDAELDFRPATEDDLPVMAEMVREAFDPVGKRLGIDRHNTPHFAAYETAESLREQLARWNIRMFLLVVDGVAVGCGGWSPDAEGAPRGWLARIAVRPAWQGRGYGRMIVRRLEDELRREGFTRVRLAHADLHRFYERLGYRTMETKEMQSWGGTLTYTEKDL